MEEDRLIFPDDFTEDEKNKMRFLAFASIQEVMDWYKTATADDRQAANYLTLRMVAYYKDKPLRAPEEFDLTKYLQKFTLKGIKK